MRVVIYQIMKKTIKAKTILSGGVIDVKEFEKGMKKLICDYLDWDFGGKYMTT